MDELNDNSLPIDLNALKALDESLTKQFGDKYFGITQKRQVEKVRFVKTDCYSWDTVMGGGIPEGRLILAYGQESSGKSLLAMTAIASYQKQGKICSLIDGEAAFDPAFAEMCGVDVSKLIIVKVECSEDAWEALRTLTKSGLVSFICLDSIASLSPRESQEKAVDENTMAIGARYAARFLPELMPIMAKNKCTLFAINQTRDSLKMYAPPESLPGGKSWKYYASIILKVTRKEILKKNSEEIGIVVEIKATKNKVGSPFKAREVSIYFPYYDPQLGRSVAGIDLLSDLIDSAIEQGVVKKGGAWLTYIYNSKEIRAQGKEKFRSELLSNPEITAHIKTRMNGKDGVVEAAVEDNPEEVA